MEQVYSWVKNVMVGLCLMELFSHLVRREDYRRYIRFFGGIIVLVMIISPVLQLFSGTDLFDEALQRAMLQEEAINIELANQTLAELQNRKISEVYQQELERQMREIAESHHQRVISINTELEERAGYAAEIKSVTMLVAKIRSGVSVFETEKGERQGQMESLEEIKTEIASMYNVEKEQITINIKE
ncbi:MAG: stage III sporulation protein AF [Eubacteriales bacterium]|nr:stage III sporulation protein AF [Eubacteriales bacterium]